MNGLQRCDPDFILFILYSGVAQHNHISGQLFAKEKAAETQLDIKPRY
jgi:hypothetical protein